MRSFHTYFIGIRRRHNWTLAREQLSPGSTAYLSCELDQVPSSLYALGTLFLNWEK